MKVMVKNNLAVIAIYVFILAVAAYFLLTQGKVQIHIFLNQLVGNKVIDTFFYYLTYLGDGAVAPFILLAIMFYNLRLGICCLISFLLAAIVTNVIKYGFYDEVVRPWFVFQWYVHEKLNYVDSDMLHIHNSFPSGHSTQAFAIFICLSLFAKKNINKILLLLVALFTAFSRVYLSQHWLVDITVGSIIGTSAAMLLYYQVVVKDRFKKFDKALLKIKSS
jgi:membrane-associated phospholipid phosphatase